MNQKLLDLLLSLHKKKQSGIVRIEQESARKQIVLEHGQAALAESNLSQEHLARIMVAMNLLPRQKLGEVASLMKEGKTSEEAILETSPETGDLEKGRREQAVTILSSLLAWEDCTIRFHPGEGLLRYQASLGLHLPGFILDSTRRAVSKRLLQADPNFWTAGFIPAEDMNERMSLFPLNKTELFACSFFSMPQNASDVLPLIPSDGSSPEEILLCLFSLGLIRQVGSDPEDEKDSSGKCLDETVQKLEEMLAKFVSSNFYEVLSVSSDAAQDEIQAAYHVQAKNLHPDHFQSSQFSNEARGMAEKIFAIINEAYRTLRNPVSRKDYDAKRYSGKSASKGAQANSMPPEQTADALYREARVLLARGEVDKAVERLKGCVWLCPGKRLYHHFLGVAESDVPKLRKDAEQHLLRAIELEDLSADSHLALAKLYIQVRLPRKAEQQLHQALLWDPHSTEALQIAAELKKLL